MFLSFTCTAVHAEGQVWLSQRNQIFEARGCSVGQGPVAPLPALKHAWIASTGPVIRTVRDLPLLLQHDSTLSACVFPQHSFACATDLSKLHADCTVSANFDKRDDCCCFGEGADTSLKGFVDCIASANFDE